MMARLIELGVMLPGGSLAPGRPKADSLYALYARAGRETRSLEALRMEGARKLEVLAERGFDLGYGHGPDYEAPPEIDERMESIYRNARSALYAVIDEAVLRDTSPDSLRVRTRSTNREEYLSSPLSGELIRGEDAARVTSAFESRPEVLVVVSDGLNANAVNENLRALLRPLKAMLLEAGFCSDSKDVIVGNGRVRAGYHIGELTGARMVIHLIGERPGTGRDSMSAYLTYGYDEAGNPLWDPALEHSRTTAVCGITPGGKDPADAALEIFDLAGRILKERRSGVLLSGGHKTPGDTR